MEELSNDRRPSNLLDEIVLVRKRRYWSPPELIELYPVVAKGVIEIQYLPDVLYMHDLEKLFDFWRKELAVREEREVEVDKAYKKALHKQCE